MARCGYRWKAPRPEPPPSTEVRFVPQICALPQSHKGDHRSLTNVVTKNNDPRGSRPMGGIAI